MAVHAVKPWSRKYARCRECVRSDRPHKAKGLCTACYDALYYVENREAINRREKAWRMARDDAEHASAAERSRRWKEDNPERVRLHRDRYNHKRRKFNVGQRVRVNYAGFPCMGTVVALSRCVLSITLDGGTRLTYGKRSWKDIELV